MPQESEGIMTIIKIAMMLGAIIAAFALGYFAEKREKERECDKCMKYCDNCLWNWAGREEEDGEAQSKDTP